MARKQSAAEMEQLRREFRVRAEAVLQSRAAYLSEDDRAARFYDRRPRSPAAGKNRRKWAA